MHLRPATPDDCAAMVELLQGLTDAGKRTRPSDAEFVMSVYIAGPHLISSTLAFEGDKLLGLQVLSVIQPDNPDGSPAGWGSIGTHVAVDGGRKGVGRALFPETKAAAVAFGLTDIEAFIGADNAEGLGYYEAMGFRTYRTFEDRVCKRLSLTA